MKDMIIDAVVCIAMALAVFVALGDLGMIGR